MEKPVLLAVMAHPDDETFGIGGTLAYYARRGVSVHVICATRGEAGDVDEIYMQGFESIADRRVHELCCAAKILGVEKIHFLDYRDSGMVGTIDNHHPKSLASTSVEKVAADIVIKIREIRPQVIVTFDPAGGYNHPDHIAVHKATVMAFNQSNDSNFKTKDLLPYKPQRLYFNTFAKNFLKIVVKILSFLGKDPTRFGRNGDINLVSIAQINYPIHAVIPYRSVADIRDQASACYESQGGKKINQSPMGWVRRLIGLKETFMQAYPEPEPGYKTRDLFKGVQHPLHK